MSTWDHHDGPELARVAALVLGLTLGLPLLSSERSVGREKEPARYRASEQVGLS